MSLGRTSNILILLMIRAGAAAWAAEDPPAASLSIHRAPGPITIDGDLSDEGWKQATVVDVFYEINPGDNVPPPVKTVARIGYDDRFFAFGAE